VHRSGRTARLNAEGVSVLLVTPLEYKKLFYINTSLTKEKLKEIKEFPVDEAFMEPIKRRVDLARKIYKLAAPTKVSSHTILLNLLAASRHRHC
jgi:ATP-dependent RNA helicase DDX24/MAK5